ncbi:hypothetical protein F8388_006221 [Cannabis sativa]|uniref:CCHC-type domain-containing protein n=1 Tax=Cannabis sativa TaxID=3483 RepID=A0A7J6G9C6_CANSA|nr:hypothetical protein F8388_006221 [Cannabis sativa]
MFKNIYRAAAYLDLSPKLWVNIKGRLHNQENDIKSLQRPFENLKSNQIHHINIKHQYHYLWENKVMISIPNGWNENHTIYPSENFKMKNFIIAHVGGSFLNLWVLRINKGSQLEEILIYQISNSTKGSNNKLSVVVKGPDAIICSKYRRNINIEKKDTCTIVSHTAMVNTSYFTPGQERLNIGSCFVTPDEHVALQNAQHCEKCKQTPKSKREKQSLGSSISLNNQMTLNRGLENCVLVFRIQQKPIHFSILNNRFNELPVQKSNPEYVKGMKFSGKMGEEKLTFIENFFFFVTDESEALFDFLFHGFLFGFGGRLGFQDLLLQRVSDKMAGNVIAGVNAQSLNSKSRCITFNEATLSLVPSASTVLILSKFFLVGKVLSSKLIENGCSRMGLGASKVISLRCSLGPRVLALRKYLLILSIVQIEINVNNPLFCGRFIKFVNGAENEIQFKYEQIDIYCYLCGRLGHQRGSCSLSSPVTVLNPSGIPYPLYALWLNTSSKYPSCFSGNLELSSHWTKSSKVLNKIKPQLGRLLNVRSRGSLMLRVGGIEPLLQVRKEVAIVPFLEDIVVSNGNAIVDTSKVNDVDGSYSNPTFSLGDGPGVTSGHVSNVGVGILSGSSQPSIFNLKLLNELIKDVASSGPYEAFFPIGSHASPRVDDGPTPILLVDYNKGDSCSSLKGQYISANLDENRSLANFFQSQERYIKELKEIGNSGILKLKASCVDIGIQTPSEVNEQTTPIKKRRLNFEEESRGWFVSFRTIIQY